MTNRELYLHVTGFGSRYGGERLRSLEEYLRVLYALAAPHQSAEPTVEQFAGWLEAAFTAPPAPFDAAWLDRKRDFGLDGFDGWEDCLLFQIADLHGMERTGQLSDPQRYFGIDAPSGSRWYNFDPLSFLECGVRGTWGGYEEEEVIVLIPPPEGESADSLVEEITGFDWDDCTYFLTNGQSYE